MAGCLLIRAGQVALAPDGDSRWRLPADPVGWDEPVAAAARRVAREQAALAVEFALPLDVLSAQDDPRGPFALIVFAAEVPAGATGRPELGWFAPAAIPWHSLSSEADRAALQAWLLGSFEL